MKFNALSFHYEANDTLIQKQQSNKNYRYLRRVSGPNREADNWRMKTNMEINTLTYVGSLRIASLCNTIIILIKIIREWQSCTNANQQ